MAPQLICYEDGFKAKSKRINKIWSMALGVPRLRNAKQPVPGAPAFFYGVTHRQISLFDKIRSSGLDWYYCDNGYVPAVRYPGSRYATELFRITKNAPQIDGTGKPDHKRRELYMPEIKPWRQNGRDILVCLQSDLHHELWGSDAGSWLKDTMATLSRVTDRNIVVRDKPLRDRSAVPFSVALKNAYAVVTYNSRVAVEGILAGVPAFVSVTCAASPMANTDLKRIEHPDRPEGREEWSAVLAANQWTLQEMESGRAWRDLQEIYG